VLGEGAPSERAIVFCVGAVQFVNILDFVIVMPLGPDFAASLGIPLPNLGYIGGAYTAAASVSGLACAFFLDKFDRRKALSVAVSGLVLGTLAGAFARGFATLLLARIVAGAFGGPATSLAYSIIADVVPAERRGKAVGAVMGAFAIASVLGVPAGLELARHGGFRLPFVAVALLGALLGSYAHWVLPPMFGHLAKASTRSFFTDVAGLVRTDVLLSWTMTMVSMAASFTLVPHLSAYTLGNLHYPRKYLGLLYLVGGVVSFVSMRLVGPLVDRFGSARVGTFGSLFVALVVYLGFARFPPPLPAMAIFAGFMFGMAFRNVSYSTLTTKVPLAHERARFQSIQSSVQHLAAASGAFASSQLLADRGDGSLAGMPAVAWTSIGIGLCLPPLLWIVERRVLRRT
jgi:predicted MFS family arabinose efflux permease